MLVRNKDKSCLESVLWPAIPVSKQYSVSRFATPRAESRNFEHVRTTHVKTKTPRQTHKKNRAELHLLFPYITEGFLVLSACFYRGRLYRFVPLS